MDDRQSVLLSKGRAGFTLVELLVVMLIIAILIGLLLPAVNAARESARRTTCQNNIKQIVLAVANHEAQHRRYPSSWKATAPDPSTGAINGWSVLGQILPYLEQGNLYSKIDFTQGYSVAPPIVTADGVSTKLTAMRIPTYLCPSEKRDEPKLENGVVSNYPVNYAFNLGTWLVYDPNTNTGGLGAFFPNSKLSAADFKDGLSNTMCCAEVKAWTSAIRNAALPADPGIPTSTQVCSLGGTYKAATNHTEWADGRCNHSGFTTVFRPNSKVLCSTGSGTDTDDVDWVNQSEGKSTTIPTWAALTARSYHDGAVNVGMMDGSVRSFANDIDQNVWRAYSTRAGGEIMPSTQQGQ
jgi:prepilin-type N-terminal cleavage/methylation domain-containing protein/prepilin-type processing-associated H-X9-DG protein